MPVSEEPRLALLREEIGAAQVPLPTVDLVVARFKEDLKWLMTVERELPSVRIFVYEKDPHQVGSACDFLVHAVCTPLANVGREAHTYLTHIITHHDTLADKVVFVQGGKPGVGFYFHTDGGHLMPGSDFLYDYVSPLRPPHIVFTWAHAPYVANRSSELSIVRGDYPFSGQYQVPATHDVLDNTAPAPDRCGAGHNWKVVSNATGHFWQRVKEQGGSRHDQAGANESTVKPSLRDQVAFWNAHFAQYLGPAPQPYAIFANGAVFSAAGAALRSLPIAFYEGLRRELLHVNPLAGFYLEFYWAYIAGFGEEARACGDSIKLQPAAAAA